MAAPLDQLTVESFTPHVGTNFVAHCAEAATLPLELVGAQPVGPPPHPGSRAQFALHFRGSGPLILQQGIYRLEHAVLDELEIFLVPIAREGANFLYEAIFT